jgi:hypothetical protein
MQAGRYRQPGGDAPIRDIERYHRREDSFLNRLAAGYRRDRKTAPESRPASARLLARSLVLAALPSWTAEPVARNVDWHCIPLAPVRDTAPATIDGPAGGNAMLVPIASAIAAAPFAAKARDTGAADTARAPAATKATFPLDVCGRSASSVAALQCHLPHGGRLGDRVRRGVPGLR